jgi:outer membrane receptor protein involved in Fe transport
MVTELTSRIQTILRGSLRPVQLGAAGLLVLAATDIGAQEQPATAPAAEASGGLQEVVVTAERRSQNVQQVPIAVTAFTAESLQSRALGDIHSLAMLTPGVNLDAGAPFSGDSSVLSASIRGIGQDDFAFNLNPGVGVYLDGVYLARTIGANQNLLDVDRVEILKGPQGTLFGANTIGGAISIVTHEPGNEERFIAQATGGSFDRRDFAFTADMPIISDTLLSSITVSTQNRDGWVKVVPYPSDTPMGSNAFVVDPQTAYPKAGYATNDNYGGQGLDTIRGKLVYHANDRLSFTFTGDWSHENQTALPYTVLGVYNGTNNLNIATGFQSLFATLYNGCISNGTALGTGIVYGAFNGPMTPNTCSQPRAQVPGLSIGGAPLGGAGYVGGPPGPYNISNHPGTPYLGSSQPRLYFNCNAVSTGTIISTSGFGDCAAPGTGLDTTYANGPDFARYDAFGFSLTGVYKLTQDIQLKSITGYRQIKWDIGTDLDGTPETLQEVSDQQHQFQVSEEVQLLGTLLDGKLNYVGGVYAFKEAGYVHDYVPFESLLYVYDFSNDITNEDYAAFLHVDYQPNDYWGFTAGGRFTDVETSFLGGQGDLNNFPSGNGQPVHYFVDSSCPLGTAAADTCPAASSPDKQSWKVFDPTLGIQYHIDKNRMLYVSWSKGFKQGGWTTRLQGQETFQDARFSPEYSKTTEVGFKSEWLDHHLQANIAAFYTDYDGIQLNVQQNISPVYLNAGNATIKGGELELKSIVGHGLSLNFAGSYIDAHYTSVNANAFIPQYAESDGTIHCPSGPPACLSYPGVVSTDAKLPKTPKYKVAFFPEYDYNLRNEAQMRLLVAFTYTASMYNDALNTPELFRPATRNIDASLHYVSPSGNYDLAVGGTNLTDDRYVTGGSPNYGAGEVGGYFNPPREWYVNLQAKLGR